MSNYFRCPVCYSDMVSRNNEPKVLPCGHTLCISCLDRIIRDNPECPMCKKDLGMNIDKKSYPKNFHLLSMLNEGRSGCQKHNSPLDLVCVQCRVLVCPKCFIKSDHLKHEVETADDMFNVVIDKVKGLSKWDEKLLQSNKKLEDCFNLLEEKMVGEISTGFDERINILTKRKAQSLKICKEYLGNIKKKYIGSRIAPNKSLPIDFVGDNRTKNLEKGLNIYTTDINVRIEDIRKVIEKDSLKDMVEESSKLHARFLSKPDDVLNNLFEIKVKSDNHGEDVRNSFMFLSEKYSTKNPLQSVELFSRALDYTSSEESNTEVFEKLAKNYAFTGDLSKAIKTFEKAISLKKDDQTGASEKAKLNADIQQLLALKGYIYEEPKDIPVMDKDKKPPFTKTIASSPTFPFGNILQVLAHNRTLTHGLLLNEGLADDKDLNMIPIYIRILWSYYYGELKVTSILELEESFEGAKFDTAPEFLSYFQSLIVTDAKVSSQKAKGLDKMITDLWETELKNSSQCRFCNHITHASEKLYNVVLPIHSSKNKDFNIILILHDADYELIGITVPETANYFEIMKKVTQEAAKKLPKETQNLEEKLILGVETKDRDLEIVTEDKTVPYLNRQNIDQIFVYYIPSLEGTQINTLSLIKLYISRGSKGSRYGTPRLISVTEKDTLQSISLKAYEVLRPNIERYFTQQGINPEMDLTDNKNLEKEYQRIMESSKLYELFVKMGPIPKSDDLENITKVSSNLSFLEFLTSQGLQLIETCLEVRFVADFEIGPTYIDYKKPSRPAMRTGSDEYKLIDCFNLLTRKSAVIKNNQNCMNCGNFSNQIVKTEIQRLPDYLILTLDKFSGDRNQIQKVGCPLNFDLGDFLPENEKAKGKYKLAGMSLAKNQYESFWQSMIEKKWYRVEKDKVSDWKFSMNVLGDENTYILYYSRI